MTWLWITLAVYAVIAIGFFVAILVEAPKHNVKVGFIHFVVAVLWPFVVIRYLYSLYIEWKAK